MANNLKLISLHIADLFKKWALWFLLLYVIFIWQWHADTVINILQSAFVIFIWTQQVDR